MISGRQTRADHVTAYVDSETRVDHEKTFAMYRIFFVSFILLCTEYS